ncbi:MAG: hypothetical protein HYZ53_15950 [Planctomycetes bacterium]|nr:hypothetical protein [Planctomycetota bacterium]
MKRFVRLPMVLEMKDFPGHRWVGIDVRKTPLPDWCLNLCLLHQNLVDAVVVSDPQGIGGVKLEFRKDHGLTGAQRARVRWDPTTVSLHLSPAEIETWVKLFLEYYRDGIAAQEQLELQAPPVDAAAKVAFVTVRLAD